MLVKIAEKCGTDYVTIARKKWSAQKLHNAKLASINKAKKKEIATDAKERYLAIIFILHTNKNRIAK